MQVDALKTAFREMAPDIARIFEAGESHPDYFFASCVWCGFTKGIEYREETDGTNS